MNGKLFTLATEMMAKKGWFVSLGSCHDSRVMQIIWKVMAHRVP
ncbi:hypothetical protein [Guopingia tenuis]|nr:hypothetical protein [Guopingia tenuis]